MNKQTLQAYIQLTRIDRPVGIYLVLWPALWALWLAADTLPSTYHLFVFTLGAIIMRSAGCVINDYADRNFDGYVKRTCNRPLATGAITPKRALQFFALLCLLALGLVLTLNSFTIWLSLGALALAALYPFMKRHTYWPQAFLGAAFAWAVPMAFAAEQEQVPFEAWIVFAVVMIWALVYDTAYAIADKEDDLKIGVKSTAILFGQYVNAVIGFFQLLILVIYVWIGTLFELGIFYELGIAIAALLFIYQQRLLRQNDPKQAFKAFLNNHWVGLIILTGTVFDKLS